jgi:hypothetical protein
VLHYFPDDGQAQAKKFGNNIQTCDRRYNNNWHIHAILGFEDN